MDLPPGPRAPAAWQTVAWMARPAAFMRARARALRRPGHDPHLLDRGADGAVLAPRRGARGLPARSGDRPRRRRAGSSCGRSPAQHSILLLDGDAHLRERRLMQAPFHGERMRAFGPGGRRARARRAEHLARARDDARAHAPPDARDHPARRVRRARRRRDRAAARRRRRHARHASARCRGCWRWRSSSATSGRAARGAASASPSSASTRCCSTSSPAGGAPPRATTRCSPLLLEQRDEDGNPTDRPPPARPARGAARRRPRQLGRLAGLGVRAPRAPPRGAGAPARRRPRLPRRRRQGGRCGSRPSLTDRAAPAARAGADRRPHGCPPGVQVAACLWLAIRREDLWPQAARVPARALARGPAAEPAVVDPVRRRRAPLRRRAVRRDGDARGAARGRGDLTHPPGPARARARAAQHARRRPGPRRRGARRLTALSATAARPRSSAPRRS